MSTTIPAKKPGDFVIIHATDLKPDGDGPFEHGVALARDGRARLVSVHASQEPSERPMPEASDVLKRWSYDGEPLEYHKLMHECCDDPVDTLLDALRDLEPDLLVVGTRQLKGMKRTFKSSVAESMALDGRVATLVVPIGQSGMVDVIGRLRLRRVLLPVGDGEEVRDAIRALTGLFERLGVDDVDIFLLRVGEDDIFDYITLPKKEGWRWHRERRDGTVSEAVRDATEEKDVDLVVMATRGQDGFLDILRGTHTQQVVREAICPVLAVPVEK